MGSNSIAVTQATTFKEGMNARFNNQFFLDAKDFILNNCSSNFYSVLFSTQVDGNGHSFRTYLQTLPWPITRFKFIS